MVNLDTHIVLALVDGSLRPSERRALEDESYCISDIVIWEIGRLSLDGRTVVRLEDSVVQHLLGSMTVWPISYQIAIALRRLDFRSDPADEIIAATSLAHDVPLLTRDQRILASKVVPFAVA